MTRRGATLFALMSVLWGVPYLLIKIAVRHVAPAVIVDGRTLVGAVLLLPLAVRRGGLRPLMAAWKPLGIYCLCELGVPWLLLTDAERRLPSSLSGLLVATVPLFAVLLVSALHVNDRRRSGEGDRRPRLEDPVGLRRLGGLALGLGGVALLLGVDVHGAQLASVCEVLVVAVGYATGPVIVNRHLSGQSSLALAACSLSVVAVAYLPVAAVQLPAEAPPLSVTASILVLGIVCTAAAFVAFFELLEEMPATRAMLFTYFNPVVAVALGAAVLGERVHLATLGGLVLILAGSWIANRATQPVAVEAPG